MKSAVYNAFKIFCYNYREKLNINSGNNIYFICHFPFLNIIHVYYFHTCTKIGAVLTNQIPYSISTYTCKLSSCMYLDKQAIKSLIRFTLFILHQWTYPMLRRQWSCRFYRSRTGTLDILHLVPHWTCGAWRQQKMRSHRHCTDRAKQCNLRERK